MDAAAVLWVPAVHSPVTTRAAPKTRTKGLATRIRGTACGVADALCPSSTTLVSAGKKHNRFPISLIDFVIFMGDEYLLQTVKTKPEWTLFIAGKYGKCAGYE